MNKAYKRKDGRFEVRVYLGGDDKGRRITRSFYGKTAKEAERKALIYEKAIMPDYAVTEMTVGELVHEWLRIVSSRIKASTYVNYRIKAEKHILPAFGEVNCCELKARDIYTFIEQKTAERLSVRYIADLVSLLKTVYKYANREYNIKNVIDGVALPKAPKKEVQLLNSSEQAVLIRYIEKRRDTTSLGMALALFMGLRIGELCALKWQDIDLEKRTLTVSKTLQRIKRYDGESKTGIIISEPKSRGSNRVIPIPECIIELMISMCSLRIDEKVLF